MALFLFMIPKEKLHDAEFFVFSLRILNELQNKIQG